MPGLPQEEALSQVHLAALLVSVLLLLSASVRATQDLVLLIPEGEIRRAQTLLATVPCSLHIFTPISTLQLYEVGTTLTSPILQVRSQDTELEEHA